MAEAMHEVYGREVTLHGSGGSIPLCNVFQETFPDAEIMLLGVEEPQSLIHAPNESVDPARSRAWHWSRRCSCRSTQALVDK